MSDHFSPSVIHASVKSALASIPADAHGVLLAKASQQDGHSEASAVVAWRTDKGWGYMVKGEWVEHHGISGEVAVEKVWK